MDDSVTGFFFGLYFTILLTYSLVDRCMSHGVSISANGELWFICFLWMYCFLQLRNPVCGLRFPRSDPAIVQNVMPTFSERNNSLPIIKCQDSDRISSDLKYLYCFSIYSKLRVGYFNDKSVFSGKDTELFECFSKVFRLFKTDYSAHFSDRMDSTL